MSHRSKQPQAGFTIIELLMVIILIGMMAGTTYSFFNSSLSGYFSLQADASGFTDIATQSQRIAQVMRGITGITSATSSDIVAYAYFSPSDNYVSIVHYYKANGNTVLMADVTPMTANPPIGVPISGSKKSHVIVNNYKQSGTTNLFTYLNASGNVIVTPIADLTTIKGIRISLASPTVRNPTVEQVISVQVSLRNFKTNL